MQAAGFNMGEKFGESGRRRGRWPDEDLTVSPVAGGQAISALAGFRSQIGREFYKTVCREYPETFMEPNRLRDSVGLPRRAGAGKQLFRRGVCGKHPRTI